MTNDSPVLPRLLYIGDVPVESSCDGSALVFQLRLTWILDVRRTVTLSALGYRHQSFGDVWLLPDHGGIRLELRTQKTNRLCSTKS